MFDNISDFWKKYELVNSSDSHIPSYSKSKVCRYCEKTIADTTFSQKTHLMPELLGKNNLLTFDECDSCNKLFSNYESNLSTFIRPYISIFGVNGKKKVPTFQSRMLNTKDEKRTTFKHIGPNHKMLQIECLNDYFVNPENKTCEILFRQPPFVPLKVYRALLKIGLSLLSGKLDKYNKRSFEWLTNRTEDLTFINQAYITTLQKSYFIKASADLYRARKLHEENIEYPEHVLTLCYANQVIQIFLPFSDEFQNIHNATRTLSLNFCPAFAFEKIKLPQTIKIETYNLGISNSVTENLRVTFNYGSADLNITSCRLSLK